MKILFKIIALLSTSLFIACTSTEEKVNDLLQRHMDSFVLVEGGSFMMGNPGLGWALGADSYPAHKVTLDSFSIQKYEVTQGDMDLFMEVTEYVSVYEHYDKTRDRAPKRFSEKLPAAAAWDDANAFCQWLSSLNGISINLPTEAQWEYAARSGGKMYQFATDTGKAVEDINMAAKSKGIINNPDALPLPPGSFPPNPLGLYDMSGNVAEFVSDNYQPDYYQSSPINNPKGPDTPQTHSLQGNIYQEKVARGGRFFDFWGNTTVSRLNVTRTLVGLSYGFRCAMQQ